MDKHNIQSWMEGYIKPWRSNAAEDIGRLFTVAALYYTVPYREPWRGRENIVAGWHAAKTSQTSGSFAISFWAL